ncbi:integrase catalytic domain-containing protein [Streptomyces sp. SudanB52_2052]|uniref:integrase catalytic domain-containing protein n=1 Tax=Streptomyces sp. SudanB52_2052 TaxID=3035276 RepID=UPI003F54CAF0
MLDSTPLDVLAVLDDGVTGRLELCIALDVATRSICAAVLRPVVTTSVDAAMLLAQMVVPTAMRPGWDAALSMQRSVIPYERLIALDARLEQAAAQPVIMPETVIVDQGRVYVSASFVSACESLGISVQPVPPANGPAKGNVERTFRAIADGFSQYLPGHTGSDVSQRGAAAEQDASWSLIHAGAVRRPFTAFTFDHVRRTVERRHDREEHEAAIAQALDALLRRASQGLGSRRKRTVAARAQAAAQMTDPSPATTPQQWPAPLAPGASFGLPGSFTVPLQDADSWDADDSLDDIEDNQDDEDYLLAALADGQDAAAGHADEAEASEPTAETTQDQAAEQTLNAAGAGGMRIYDPYQEAQAW